jgi:hypothetical protein
VNLYFIEGSDGGIGDLLVRAQNHFRALDHWRVHCETTAAPLRILLVMENVAGKEGPLPWQSMQVCFLARTVS